jgi:hypothetical protein
MEDKGMELEEPQEAQLRELVGQLESLIPREGAHLTLAGDSGSRTSVGNRLGYLRLGVELLAAALNPLPPSDQAPTRIEPDLGYLLSDDSDALFELSEIDEAIGSRPPVESRLGLVGHLVAGVGLVAVLIAVLVLVFLLLRWIFT